MSEDRKSPHELVIVRSRGGGHDDGHHGGAWKIAFADFMTALMCFFLVMWLINSTDKKTITQIAAYFNPMRLNDRNPSNKGVHSPGPAEPTHEKADEEGKKTSVKNPPKKGKEEQGAKPGKASVAEKNSGQKAEPKENAAEVMERDLLREPFATLDQIAASGVHGAAKEPVAAKREAGLPLDVFDAASPTERLPARASAKPASEASDAAQAAQVKHAESAKKKEESGGVAIEAMQEPNGQITTGKQLEKAIQEALVDIDPGKRPNVEVADSNNELLISLTDDFDFGMFAIASARPSRELIFVIERIAKVLEKTRGSVTIRGHTDGRQYRNTSNDNWRLSMSRAQVAFYMLVRGGLDEKRVKRLEGDADRLLRVTSDPMAPQNRRIEILVGKGQR